MAVMVITGLKFISVRNMFLRNLISVKKKNWLSCFCEPVALLPLLGIYWLAFLFFKRVRLIFVPNTFFLFVIYCLLFSARSNSNMLTCFLRPFQNIRGPDVAYYHYQLSPRRHEETCHRHAANWYTPDVRYKYLRKTGESRRGLEEFPSSQRPFSVASTV